MFLWCFNSLLFIEFSTQLYLANAGIPAFSLSIIHQIVLLIPIVVIEAYILKKILPITIVKASLVASAANILSTVLGAIFFFLIGLGLAGKFSQTIVNPGSFPHPPIDIIITLIPMYFASVFIELLFGAFILKKILWRKILKTFTIANAYTYLMLETLAISKLIKGYIENL